MIKCFIMKKFLLILVVILFVSPGCKKDTEIDFTPTPPIQPPPPSVPVVNTAPYVSTGSDIFIKSPIDTCSLIGSAFDDNDNIFNAICAGASGYLLKTSGIEEIIGSIRQVLNGGAPMTGQVARRTLQMFTRFAPRESSSELTPREKKVLELLAADYAKKSKSRRN